jgi:adenylate cyclase
MNAGRRQPTLTQVFLLTFGAVALVVAFLFAGMLASARRAVVERSETSREAAAARIDARIRHDLGEAKDVVSDVERAVLAEAVDARTPQAVEAPLFALLLDHPNVADITLTHPSRWQVSVFRAKSAPDGPIDTRTVGREGDHFVADVRVRAPGAKLRAGVVTREVASDPTAHPTYETTVSPELYGKAIWSDLHFSELDDALPERDRRVVVTVQKAIDDASGKAAGVVRVGLLAGTVDLIANMRVEDDNAALDPHRVFLCDAEGRLLTRLVDGDRLASSDGDLRVVPARLAPETARALASPLLRKLTVDRPVKSEAFVVSGRRYLLTLRALENTQGWIAAILVPEDHYTRDLRGLVVRMVGIAAVGALCGLLGGGFVLARIRGGLRRLLATTARMRDFDFAPDPRPSALRDVDEVVQGLERAKTAMRALGKYVPVDLVRELYASNREPALGGTLARLTLMFTDIRGFTELSERLPPAELAQALGRYLEAMTTAIRATGGTIDKFIGDSVMAMWNAPSPQDGHATLACGAALACVESTQRLYASEAWKGLPPLVTRFGIHRRRSRGQLRRARTIQLHRPRRRREPRVAARGPLQTVRRDARGERNGRDRGARRVRVSQTRPRRGQRKVARRRHLRALGPSRGHGRPGGHRVRGGAQALFRASLCPGHRPTHGVRRDGPAFQGATRTLPVVPRVATAARLGWQLGRAFEVVPRSHQRARTNSPCPTHSRNQVVTRSVISA